MLDGAQPRLGGLQDRQRIGRVRRCLQPVRLGRLDGVEEDIRFQRVVGDLDEVDVHRLQPVERRVDLGRRADLDRALPERIIALQLRSGGVDGGSEQRAVRHLASPFEHGVADVGRGIAHRGDAISHINRKEVPVLLDQLRSAAEMHVHVPEAGHHIFAGGVDHLSACRRARRRRKEERGGEGGESFQHQSNIFPNARLARVFQWPR